MGEKVVSINLVDDIKYDTIRLDLLEWLEKEDLLTDTAQEIWITFIQNRDKKTK